ncbi:hypothetical protein VPH35_099309 [Triticum aestivum]|uniref:Uncharacterized protein n=1 Tax=Aegilops tauschii subsp. strangulata TaxID=200361 RepID=A0A453LIS7_AEGTS
MASRFRDRTVSATERWDWRGPQGEAGEVGCTCQCKKAAKGLVSNLFFFLLGGKKGLVGQQAICPCRTSPVWFWCFACTLIVFGRREGHELGECNGGSQGRQ